MFNACSDSEETGDMSDFPAFEYSAASLVSCADGVSMNKGYASPVPDAVLAAYGALLLSEGFTTADNISYRKKIGKINYSWHPYDVKDYVSGDIRQYHLLWWISHDDAIYPGVFPPGCQPD